MQEPRGSRRSLSLVVQGRGAAGRSRTAASASRERRRGMSVAAADPPRARQEHLTPQS